MQVHSINTHFPSLSTRQQALTENKAMSQHFPAQLHDIPSPLIATMIVSDNSCPQPNNAPDGRS